MEPTTARINMQNDRPKELGSEHRAPFGLNPSELEDLPEKQRSWLEATRRNIPAIASQVEGALSEARQQLEEDDRFTEEGVAQKMSEVKAELRSTYLSDQANEDLPGSGLAHQKYVARRVKREAHQKLQDQPLVPEADPSDARSAVREQRILEKLEATDPSERAELAQRLVDSGSPEALRAIFDPPGGMTPLHEHRIQMLKQRARRNLYGEESVQAERMLEAGEKAEQAVERLEGYVRSLLED